MPCASLSLGCRDQKVGSREHGRPGPLLCLLPFVLALLIVWVEIALQFLVSHLSRHGSRSDSWKVQAPDFSH